MRRCGRGGAVALVVALAVALAVGPPAVAATSGAPRRSTTPTRPTPAARILEVPAGELREVSGCAVSRRDPSRVWMHNDSGAGARLHWLDLRTKARGSVDLRGAEAVDWEDMAPGPGGTLVVGDIGDNNRRRPGVVLYRVPEPGPGAAAVDASGETLTYEDGPHDAEALVVDPGDGTAYVLTKEPTGTAGVYRAGDGVLRRVATVRISGEAFLYPNMVTAADVLPDGSAVVVRTYQRGYLLRRSKKGGAFTDLFTAPPRPFDLPAAGQFEALCVAPDGRSVVTASEAIGGTTFTIAVAPLPA